jgi:hypothetical protein
LVEAVGAVGSRHVVGGVRRIGVVAVLRPDDLRGGIVEEAERLVAAGGGAGDLARENSYCPGFPQMRY